MFQIGDVAVWISPSGIPQGKVLIERLPTAGKSIPSPRHYLIRIMDETFIRGIREADKEDLFSPDSLDGMKILADYESRKLRYFLYLKE